VPVVADASAPAGGADDPDEGVTPDACGALETVDDDATSEDAGARRRAAAQAVATTPPSAAQKAATHVQAGTGVLVGEMRFAGGFGVALRTAPDAAGPLATAVGSDLPALAGTATTRASSI
jgi:hypothetical protein